MFAFFSKMLRIYGSHYMFIFFVNKKLSRKIVQEWERHCNGGKFQQFFLSLLKWLVNSQYGSIKQSEIYNFEPQEYFLWILKTLCL